MNTLCIELNFLQPRSITTDYIREKTLSRTTAMRKIVSKKLSYVTLSKLLSLTFSNFRFMKLLKKILSNCPYIIIQFVQPMLFSLIQKILNKK